MIPKYEQIKQDLLTEIKTNKFVPGDKFYSEAAIKQKYAVSSITAVKALNELTNAGYLYRVQGKGTFISRSKVAETVKFSDLERNSFDKEHVTVLSIEEKNDATILHELKLPSDETYYKIKRVRYFDETPFLVHLTHLPKKLMKQPLADDLSTYTSVYERIRSDFGIDLFSLASVETNEIVFPDDPELLRLLNLSFREPAVKQVKHSYLPDKSVAEYIVSYKHWKYFKTKIEVEAK
ncbi:MULTISPECIES: GntR family transcriptional regulator [Enterococcus]|uniref:GntR family transcriptional regulator n=1 Tax=Enterococcus thailandicus TaxID=417368 RepID=A0A179EUP9_ENTTH|nr:MULTISPECIES: GntR family transcriptional regulator [Enterococcus]OAQ56892.1 GntR family transcriptional regulator [Enterococcus thailandicus]OTP23647.1 GntR family transcriptional regulator [Enterococcus sp. 5B7_DIV0075]